MEVAQVSPEQAAAAFVAVRDPEGLKTPEAMAMDADVVCAKFTTESGECVFSMRQEGAELWITAAAGQGSDLTKAGLMLAEEAAKKAKCKSVGFQTARPGLVRKAQQAGFTVQGWILRKEL